MQLYASSQAASQVLQVAVTVTETLQGNPSAEMQPMARLGCCCCLQQPMSVQQSTTRSSGLRSLCTQSQHHPAPAACPSGPRTWQTRPHPQTPLQAATTAQARAQDAIVAGVTHVMFANWSVTQQHLGPHNTTACDVQHRISCSCCSGAACQVHRPLCAHLLCRGTPVRSLPC